MKKKPPTGPYYFILFFFYFVKYTGYVILGIVVLEKLGILVRGRRRRGDDEGRSGIQNSVVAGVLFITYRKKNNNNKILMYNTPLLMPFLFYWLYKNPVRIRRFREFVSFLFVYDSQVLPNHDKSTSSKNTFFSEVVAALYL